MNTAITVLTEELRRLKSAGVKSVSVSDSSIAALRQAVQSHKRAISAKPPAKADVTASPKSAAAPQISAADWKPPAAGAPARKSIPKSEADAPLIPDPVPFELPAGDKTAQMAALRERVLKDPVCLERMRPGKQVVLGVGNLDARIMFVGEAPGAEEEVQGEPFVGPAGQLLTKMIGAMGLKREDVYLGNIMNWRPDMPLDVSGVEYGNRPPTEREMRYCLPYLRAQIQIVNPTLLVALGTTAAQGLLGVGAFKALGEVRGRWSEFAGKPLMVTYHPSYILRNQSNRSKRMIWEDLLQVMERGGLSISDKQRTFFLG